MLSWNSVRIQTGHKVGFDASKIKGEVLQLLVSRMFWTRAVHLEPFIYAPATERKSFTRKAVKLKTFLKKYIFRENKQVLKAVKSNFSP